MANRIIPAGYTFGGFYIGWEEVLYGGTIRLGQSIRLFREGTEETFFQQKEGDTVHQEDFLMDETKIKFFWEGEWEEEKEILEGEEDFVEGENGYFLAQEQDVLDYWEAKLSK